MGGVNRTLNSVETPSRLCSPGGDRKLSAVRPHSVVDMGKAYSEWKLKQDKEPVSEIDKKYQKLLETLSQEQEEVITEYCNAIFSSGAETEEFFYRLGLKDGLNLKNTVKSVLEMIS